MYLRMLTSGQIKAKSKFYEYFTDFDLYGGVDEFYAFEVDPIDKDADQVLFFHIISYKSSHWPATYRSQSRSSTSTRM